MLLQNAPLRLLVCFGLKGEFALLVALYFVLAVVFFAFGVCLPTGAYEASPCRTVEGVNEEGDGMVMVAMSRQ